MLLIRVLLFACATSVALVRASIDRNDDEKKSTCWRHLCQDRSEQSLKSSKAASNAKDSKLLKVNLISKNLVPGPAKKKIVRRQGYDPRIDPNVYPDFTLCDASTLPRGWRDYEYHLYVDSLFDSSKYYTQGRSGYSGPNGLRQPKNCGLTATVTFTGPNGRLIVDRAYMIVGLNTQFSNQDSSSCTRGFISQSITTTGCHSVAYRHLWHSHREAY